MLHVTLLAEDVASYVNQAQTLKLYDDRFWVLLLHRNGDKSEIDDPTFFLAPDGKTNPKHELVATIEALYNETSFDDNATACRFPARTRWLKEKLGLENLPLVSCQAFDALYKRVDPQAITLVFADGHINSPASMFGHTFLRIDSSYKSKLLSHAINYAANADSEKENGFTFAIKGLFGGYPGIYSLLPYYEKIKEYKSTEQRDLWEYELNLTPEELRWMLMHIWEIHNKYAWYYFFDENCSYNMLWLLEIARPSVHLREYFWYQVAPPETIMAVEEEGLLKARQYRPSKRSVLMAYEQVLDSNGRVMAKAVANGEMPASAVASDTQMTLEMKQYVLEAAAELCEYYLIENVLDKEHYLQHFQAILSERATLGKAKPLSIPQPSNPDSAHHSARVRYQVGVRNGYGTNYLGIRGSYQDLGDSDEGMLWGTRIEFFDLLLFYEMHQFYDYSKKQIDLSYHGDYGIEYFTLFSLASYAPQSAFFHPISWRARFAWDRDYRPDLPVFSTHLAAGSTWGNETAFGYVLAEVTGYADKEGIGAIAPVVGLSFKESQSFKTVGEYSHRWYSDGMRQHLVSLTQLWRIAPSLAIKAMAEFKSREYEDEKSFKASFEYYF